jgi:hypothetical protein
MRPNQSKTRDLRIAAGLLVLAGLLAGKLLAGPVVMQTPPPTPVQAQEQQDDAVNNDMAVFVPFNNQRDGSLPEPFKFEGMVFRPHGDYQFLYVNGMLASPSNLQNTFVHTITPGIAVDLGKHWTFDYSPSFVFYSDSAFHNAVNHNVSLNGRTHYEDWLFNFSQTYSHSDATLSDTATQTKDDNFSTAIDVSHQLNDKFSFDLNLSQNLNFVQNLQDSRTWSTLDWLNYQIAKRFFIGVGAGVNYTTVTGTGADSVDEQVLGRIQWRATDKLSFNANVGVDYQQILASGNKDPLNPIFGAGVQYEPFKYTQISLNAGRTVSSSDYYTQAQNTESTTVSLNVSQRLFEKFYLSGGLNYSRTDYTVTQDFLVVSGSTLKVAALSNIRTDEDYSVNLRLSHVFLKRGNVALTYQYSDNQSTEPGYSYRSNQVGFEVSFAY